MLDELPLLNLELVDEFSVVLKKQENETSIVQSKNNYAVPVNCMLGFDLSLIIEENPSVD